MIVPPSAHHEQGVLCSPECDVPHSSNLVRRLDRTATCNQVSVCLLPVYLHTGVTTLQEALTAPPGAAPDYILDSVASLAGL